MSDQSAKDTVFKIVKLFPLQYKILHALASYSCFYNSSSKITAAVNKDYSVLSIFKLYFYSYSHFVRVTEASTVS